MINRGKWLSAEEYNCKPFDYMCPEREAPEHQPPMDEPKNYHMLVRHTFFIDESMMEAAGETELAITADDYYKVWINGVYVGQGPAPGYPFRYYYNRYRIGGALRKGENVIAVHVYYQGLVNRVWYSADKRQGLKAAIWQNSRLIVATDGEWKYRQAGEFAGGRTTGYDTCFLEDIDAGRISYGWRECGYDDAGWKRCVENEYDDHELVLQETGPVEIRERVPALLKTFGEGHFLFDCGEEVVGGVRITVSGEKGDKIRLRYAEELDGDGHAKYEMRCNCTYEEEWTLSGRGADTEGSKSAVNEKEAADTEGILVAEDGKDIIENYDYAEDSKDVIESYDYKAFRYIEIITGCKNFSEKSITVVERHYPFHMVRTVREDCEPVVRKIWDLCARTVMLGTQEVYVDCPSREKGQYLGDLLVTGVSHMYLTGDGAMFKKALYDFAASTRIDKGMMAVSASGIMQEIADYSLLYPLQLYYYYQLTGDGETVRELYPCAREVLEYFQRFERADGLLTDVNTKWNMVDWPENLRDDYDFDLTRPVGSGCLSVINAYYYGVHLYLSKIEEILFRETERKAELTRLTAAFEDAFYDREAKLFVDKEGSRHSSLHVNALALYFSMQPKESEKSITELIRKKGLSCGVYMAFFVLKGLAGIGEKALAYELITGEGIHSWVNMLKEGATTCFEAWGKEQKWNTSLCHPWASAPVILFTEDLGLTVPLKG